MFVDRSATCCRVTVHHYIYITDWNVSTGPVPIGKETDLARRLCRKELHPTWPALTLCLSLYQFQFLCLFSVSQTFCVKAK
jgi:hypothetical protein